MKYFFIAGERSGDLHASNLIKELKEKDPSCEIVAWGGEQMEQAGARIVQHYSILSFMGIWEALVNLPKVLSCFSLVKKLIKNEKPDSVIFIDYAGFNLRIAKWVKANGYQTHYYISPKIWAWGNRRVHKIKKLIDRMYCILPFEKNFYNKYDFDIDYVGNPVLDSIRNFSPNERFLEKHEITNKNIIAVLPGSRKGEVRKMLHYMLAILPAFPEHQFIVAGVSNLSKEFYDNFLGRTNVKVIYDETYDILSRSKVALVTSGTATLETALFEVPQVVCYKTSLISYLIGRLLVKVKYISLPNLIVNEPLLPELIQDDFNPQTIRIELLKIIKNPSKQLEGYNKLKIILGNRNASANTAELILKYSK